MKDKTEEMSELYTMDHLNAEYSLIWKAQRQAGVLWKDIPSFTEWVLGRLQRAESIVSSLPPSGPTPEPTLSMKMRGRPVTHEEATQSARRLINSHFGNPDKARMQIPANPADDDLIVCDYIYEQSASSVPPSGVASEATRTDKAIQ